MKYAFVTGTSRGLGKGFVEYLLTEGYFVFAGVREIKEEYKNKKNLEYVVCDVIDDKSIENVVKQISSKTDSVDLIINNAGVNKDSVTNNHKEKVCSLTDLNRNHLLEMFDANSISPLMITKYFLKLLKNNPSFVINISSCRASFHDEFEGGNPNYGYTASKIALNMFTFRTAKELPENIKTFAIHPGEMKSDMNPGGNQTPLEQAEKIMDITKDWKNEFNGKFLRWSGEKYPL